MSDECGLSKMKAESESHSNESVNPSDFGFAKNYWNRTTFEFVFKLRHKPTK